MGHLFVALISVIFLLHFKESESIKDPVTQQQILDNLIYESGYDRRVPPTGEKGIGSPIQVNVTMYVIDISEVNDFRMDFSLQFYFRQSWYDPRLKYDNKEGEVNYLGLKEFDKIWRPDLFVIEEKAGKFHTLMAPNSLVRIYPDGRVLHSVRLSMTVGCKMDLSKFPLDTQNCSFNIESFGFTSDDILLTWGYLTTDQVHLLSESIDLLNFVVDNYEIKTERMTFSTGTYSRLKVGFTFVRKVSFFVTKLFVPFIILVVVSWLSFWIKPKFVSLRLSLLLAILFIMLSLASDINAYIPPVSYTKAIDVWTAFCLSVVFASLLGFVFVNQLSRKEKKLKRQNHKALLSNGCVQPVEDDIKNTSISTLDNEALHAVARKLQSRREWSKRADVFFRFAFPVMFVFFNVVFWSVYSVQH